MSVTEYLWFKAQINMSARAHIINQIWLYQQYLKKGSVRYQPLFIMKLIVEQVHFCFTNLSNVNGYTHWPMNKKPKINI